MMPWVRLPTGWIASKGLLEFHWRGDGVGSNNIAALMSLVAIAHVASQQTGTAEITYNALRAVTGLSREKLAGGLRVLEGASLVERKSDGRSHFKLSNFDPERGWAKLPVKSMYGGGRIVSFDEFKLRQRSELDALKMYLLFIAFRDDDLNAANISYSGMEKYSGIERSRIKAGISVLLNQRLVYIDQVQREEGKGVRHTYRIVGIDPYRHMGTSGRKET
jgi:hypothetical protein